MELDILYAYIMLSVLLVEYLDNIELLVCFLMRLQAKELVCHAMVKIKCINSQILLHFYVFTESNLLPTCK
jgi:hypothetical protein